MKNMNFLKDASRAHAAACWLTLAVAIGLMFSPPVVNLAEFLLVLVMLGSAELRQRLWLAWQQPMVKAVLLFYAFILVGVAYSIAPLGTAVGMASGWRKLLLLPLALALFDDVRWKTRFLTVFVEVAAAAAVLSFVLWFLNIPVYISENEPGVLLRNHATQGMLFAVGAFGSVMLSLETRWVAWRRGLMAVGLLLVANIALVTPGRSGYLVLLVCAFSALVGLSFSSQRFDVKRLLMSLLALLLVTVALAIAPTSRERIALAFNETRQYDQAKEETSMGIRVIFWKNTLEMLRERPLLGYGTGAFGEAYARKVAGQTGLAGIVARDPHNQYMKIMGEHGFLGLLAFLGILVAALRQRVAAPWRLLGLGVLLAWCGTSLANSHFSTFSEGSFIYVWLGVMLATPLGPPENSA